MICVKCGASLADDDQFCGDCGTIVRARVESCPTCRFPVRQGGTFCIKCGAALANALPRPAPDDSPTPRKSDAIFALDKEVPDASTRARWQTVASRTPRPQRCACSSWASRKAPPLKGWWPLALIVFGCALAVGVYFTLSIAERAPPDKTTARRSAEAVTASKSASGTLGKTRPDADAFSIKRAFTQLYGNYDPNLDGAFWTATGAPRDLARWNDRPVFIRPLISRSFEEAGATRHVLVTNSLDVREGDVIKQGTGCRTCGSLIGAAVFQREGKDWELISRHDFLTAAGKFGAPPKVSIVFPNAGGIELQFQSLSDDERGPRMRSYAIVLKERKDMTPAVSRTGARDGTNK